MNRLKIDFNDVDLGTVRSLQRLATAPAPLQAGEDVLLYDSEGLTALGTVQSVVGQVVSVELKRDSIARAAETQGGFLVQPFDELSEASAVPAPPASEVAPELAAVNLAA
jgi:hypothetical protein